VAARLQGRAPHYLRAKPPIFVYSVGQNSTHPKRGVVVIGLLSSAHAWQLQGLPAPAGALHVPHAYASARGSPPPRCQ